MHPDAASSLLLGAAGVAACGLLWTMAFLTARKDRPRDAARPVDQDPGLD